MCEFTGFTPQHFHYFLLHDDDEARQRIRDQVDCFAREVLARLQDVRPFYEGYDVGTLRRGDAECWAAFGPMGPKKDAYRKMTHQTITLAADGLRVFVNAERKEATDAIRSALSQTSSSRAIRNALEELHAIKPFDLVLGEKTHVQAALFTYTPKMRLHSSLLVEPTIRDVAWEAFARTVQLVPRPYLNIERLLRPAALAESVQAVQQVIEILRGNDPLVRLLNDPGAV